MSKIMTVLVILSLAFAGRSFAAMINPVVEKDDRNPVRGYYSVERPATSHRSHLDVPRHQPAAPVPEPGSMALLSVGLVGLATMRLRRNKI